MTTAGAPPTTYVTVADPSASAAPHRGDAFELVAADVFARAARPLGPRGERVRFLGGSDDHSSENVLAAVAIGVPTRELVDAHAARSGAVRHHWRSRSAAPVVERPVAAAR